MLSSPQSCPPLSRKVLPASRKVLPVEQQLSFAQLPWFYSPLLLRSLQLFPSIYAHLLENSWRSAHFCGFCASRCSLRCRRLGYRDFLLGSRGRALEPILHLFARALRLDRHLRLLSHWSSHLLRGRARRICGRASRPIEGVTTRLICRQGCHRLSVPLPNYGPCAGHSFLFHIADLAGVPRIKSRCSEPCSAAWVIQAKTT